MTSLMNLQITWLKERFENITKKDLKLKKNLSIDKTSIYPIQYRNLFQTD